MEFPNIENALHALVPDAIWSVEYDQDGSYKIIWLDTLKNQPSQKDVEAKQKELQDLWDTKDYARKRKPEYPPVEDFADALYWSNRGDDSKLKTYLDRIDLVKRRHPKPESTTPKPVIVTEVEFKEPYE